MRDFNYFQSTEIRFGNGRLKEIGEVVTRYGKRCLLVTVPPFPAFEPVFDRVKAPLKATGVKVAHFDGVVPNPTTESITAGAFEAEMGPRQGHVGAASSDGAGGPSPGW